jgi:hypothetical protein
MPDFKVPDNIPAIPQAAIRFDRDDGFVVFDAEDPPRRWRFDTRKTPSFVRYIEYEYVEAKKGLRPKEARYAAS